MLGLLVIVTIFLGSVYYLYHRRRSTPIDPDLPISSPYAVPPKTQADSKTGFFNPQIGKHRPQSTRPSGATVATAIRPMSLMTESGPPPSYQAL
jgi:hypothetical protein